MISASVPARAVRLVSERSGELTRRSGLSTPAAVGGRRRPSGLSDADAALHRDELEPIDLPPEGIGQRTARTRAWKGGRRRPTMPDLVDLAGAPARGCCPRGRSHARRPRTTNHRPGGPATPTPPAWPPGFLLPGCRHTVYGTDSQPGWSRFGTQPCQRRMWPAWSTPSRRSELESPDETRTAPPTRQWVRWMCCLAREAGARRGPVGPSLPSRSQKSDI